MIVIIECKFVLVFRNGIYYKVFDIFGIDLLDDLYNWGMVEEDIVWCLYCIFLGFYVIVLVIFGYERIMRENFIVF